jgi:hypothetical protein
MKSIARPVAVLLACLYATLPAFASVPVRGSSGNGTDQSAPFWNLFSPTEVRTLTKGTVTVNFKQQVVCTNQQVSTAVNPSDVLHAGTCADGAYLFIYQLRSSATNVTVKLSKLIGFTPDISALTYGVMLCDDNTLNTLELCTTATQAQLPNITFNWNATTTTASFGIPNFPKFPNGVKHQGQGLTIFVATQQTAPNPIGLPVISLQ